MIFRRKVEQAYGHPALLADGLQHFCPGCSHGIMAKVIAEVLGEMGLSQRAVGVYGLGCSALFYDYLEVKGVSAPAGAAIAIASGIKEAMGPSLVFTYQGESDLASGFSHLISAGTRADRITVICENNFTMGMSGGAASLTTPLGLITTTTPQGRMAEKHGFPFKIAESAAQVRGITYAARVSTHSPGAVKRAKRTIQKAFENQLYGTGTGFVEVLGMCPTNLGLPPKDLALKMRQISEAFPLGELKSP
jgi:2-oxoglutarate/2-oxoacid ferredoxin oxidoreductase subunit beta